MPVVRICAGAVDDWGEANAVPQPPVVIDATGPRPVRDPLSSTAPVAEAAMIGQVLLVVLVHEHCGTIDQSIRAQSRTEM